MGEKIFYSGEYEGATALAPALRLIGLDTLRNSQMQHLYTSGLGGLADKLVTGIGGYHESRRLTWSIRWDWDEAKNTHVNVVLTTRNKGTEKYAYLQNRRHDAPRKEYVAQNPYEFTIERFTLDCQWNKAHMESLPADKQAAYRMECAENGRNRWCIVMEGLEAQ